MRLLARISLLVIFLGFSVAVLALQRNRYQDRYNGYDGDPNEKAEFSWSRLHYSGNNSGFSFGGFRRGGSWSTDYPKADRQFLMALKRLTRINAKSTEQVVDLTTDDIFNFPFVYAVQVQSWAFTDEEAKRMREYLLKGGFLMVDDFHGVADWESFMRGMRMVFPDRQIEDLQDKDEIFHVLYDLDHRVQVPGLVNYPFHKTFEKDGIVPHWRAIYDDKHNATTGNPNSASSERMQADVQRNVNQQQRIANGMQSGALTNKEAGSLERGQAHVARREANVAANGHVSAREQRRIQGSENHQSNRIYNKKHNGTTK